MTEKPKMSAMEFAFSLDKLASYEEVADATDDRDRAQFLAGWQAGLEAAAELALQSDCWSTQLVSKILGLKPPAETKQEER